ncbi:hypothetical protein ACQCN2_06440 [Brevibacillus ginsengisoli]|uniref:hypothetical protein n=1 Tax=Brevibacillus ginsengisoli TaxID=363854 RepID=UPI003CEE32F7
MKKLLTLSLILSLIFVLTACGNQRNNAENSPNVGGGISAEVMKIISNKSADSAKLGQSVQEFEKRLGQHTTPEVYQSKELVSFQTQANRPLTVVYDQSGDHKVTHISTTKDFQSNTFLLDSKSQAQGYEDELLALASLTAFIPSDANVQSQTIKKIGERQEMHVITLTSQTVPNLVLYTIEKDNKSFEAMLTSEDPTK